MLKIRLQRIGRKNSAAFRVVVIDSHASPKAGKNVELLGSFNPHTDEFKVKADRVKYWMGKGAQVSDRTYNILISEGLIEGKKVNVLPRKQALKKEGESAAETVSEAPRESEAETPNEVESADAPLVEEEAKAS